MIEVKQLPDESWQYKIFARGVEVACCTRPTEAAARSAAREDDKLAFLCANRQEEEE